MQKNKLFKYQIGLAVVGLFALGATIFLVVQAGAAKQDSKTYEQANKTAEALNSYVDKKQALPESLDKANITYDKEAVTYEKLSSEKYKFCVTYKADGTHIDGTSLVSAVMYAGFDGQMPYDSEDYESSNLYLSYSWKKGENCHTVKPYIYDTGVDIFSDDYQEEGNSTQGQVDAKYSELIQQVDKCTNDTTLSDEAYSACVDKAYDAYYGSTGR